MYINSNFHVAQNWRFVVNPVYYGGETIDAKIWDFRLSGSLKMQSPGPLALSNSLKN